MASGRVPAAVRTRLGDDATFGLIELLDSDRREWSEHVLSVAADRFERRLTEEISALPRGDSRGAARRPDVGSAGNRDDAGRDAEVVVPLLDRPGRGDGRLARVHARQALKRAVTTPASSISRTRGCRRGGKRSILPLPAPARSSAPRRRPAASSRTTRSAPRSWKSWSPIRRGTASASPPGPAEACRSAYHMRWWLIV